MSVAEKLTTIAENQEKVYEAGKQAEYDEFWDYYQHNATLTNCNKLFAGKGWTNETFKPKHSMRPTNAYGMFWNSGIEGSLDDILSERGITIDFSAATDITYLFSASSFSKIGTIDTRSCNIVTSIVMSAKDLETIENLILREDGSQTLSSPLTYCDGLKNLTITGKIGSNGVNVQNSPLTHDSLMSIINALQNKTEDTSGTQWVVALGKSNLAELTDEEKAIATEKGWSLA